MYFFRHLLNVPNALRARDVLHACDVLHARGVLHARARDELHARDVCWWCSIFSRNYRYGVTVIHSVIFRLFCWLTMPCTCLSPI